MEENVEVEENEENLQKTKESSQEDNEVMPWEEAVETEENTTENGTDTTKNGTDTTKNGTEKPEVAPVQRKNSMTQIVDTVLTHGEANDTVATEIVSNADLKNAFEERTGVTLSGNKEQQANAVKEIVRLTAERNDSRRTETTEGKITEVVFEQGQDTKFKDDAGNTYTYQEAIQKNPEMTDAYVNATRVAIENGTQAAKVFLENYSKSYPIEIYNNGFRMMYNAGQNGIPFETSVRAADYVRDTIGQTVMKKAWNLGMNAKQAEDSKVAVQSKKQKRKGTGTYENQTAERSGGLPELERLVANRTGIDITRKSGLDHNANGSFTASTMTMLLSENAQNEYTALIHELGEFGLAYDREGMKNLQESLTRYWVSKEGIAGMNDIDSLINEYQRRYSAVEGSKTKSQAMDEIVNDALGGLFSTDEGVQEFAEWLKKDSGYTKGEQKTIVQRFIDTMDSIIKYLKTKLKDMSLTKAARKALELERQQAEDVRKQFLNVLDHAIKKANTTGEYQSEANSGKKYSLDVDVDDELAYFGVENKLNDYIGVQKAVISKLNEEEDYFGDYVNESTGMIITLGKKGIKETLSSGKRFQTQPSEIKKLKIATIRNLPNLLQKAVMTVNDAKNTHNESALFSYFETAVNIDGKACKITFDVKKSPVKNHFYIHYIRIEKESSSLLTPAQRQEINETRNSLQNGIITDDSENASTKFSLPEEYDHVKRENETLLRENETFKQIIDSLEHTLDIKEGIKLNQQSIEKAAKSMLRKYKSNVDQKSFVENVTALFQAAAKNEMSVSDFEYLAESIVRPLIEQSENNLQISDYAKDVLNDIKKTTIKLDGMQKKESAYHYGSYGNLRKNLFGRANFSENGTQLDTLWQQWAEAYPDLFDADISPVDQPVKLAEIIKSLKEDYVNE